jgi:hypothetical protein
MIALAGGDVAAMLAEWDADRRREATLRIADVIGRADWRKTRLQNAFWHGTTAQPHGDAAMRQVIAWLLRPETRERLEVACLAEHDSGAAALLSHAEGLVAGMLRAG